MRIERLSLARYGHFTDQEIELNGDGTCLHVLLGANEAGKTTALNAITDLLFGIATQTPFGFRHEYKDLRIGATLHTSDGRRLTIRRRKGRLNTLLDEAERPLDESVLASFLGGADRTIFTGLFGLTHASLRAGGDDMLAAKGDLGRMLFEAGSSMAGVIDVLDEFDAEAAALFTPRRSATKPFYVADDARLAAERKVTELALRFDDWRRNESELADTEAALEGVRRRLGDRQERNARLHRIRRTAPRLSALRAAEAELAGLAAVPALPDDASERLEEARRARSVAQDRMRRAEDDGVRAEAELSAVIVPEGLLAAEADIQRLYERRAAIIDSQGALPELAARRDDLHARLRRLLADLGCDSAGIDQCLPPAIAVARLRDLIGQDSALTDQTADAEQLRTAAAAEVTAAEAKLAAAAVPPDLTRLALAVEQAQCSGDLEGELVRAEHTFGEAAEEARRALAGLRRWHGDAERLALLAVPEHETVLRYERELGEAQRLALRAREELAAAGEYEERCARDLAALGDGTDLSTAEAVAAARALRDRGWALIRRVFIDADDVSDSELETCAKRPKLAERFERTIRDADALADRRQADAARLARHEQLTAGLEAARMRRAQRGEQVRTCDQALAALQDGWRVLWQPLGIVADPPREMDRWLAHRENVLRADDAARAAAQQLHEGRERLARERADLCGALALAGAEPCATMSFAALIEEARIRLDTGRAAEQLRAVLGERRAGALAALQQAQARIEALTKRRGEWAADWREALTLVGLPSGTAAVAGKVALELWDDVRLARTELDDVERRIGRIQMDYAEFAGDVARLLANVLPDLAATEPLAAGRRAFERLQEARGDALRRVDLQARLSAAGNAAHAAAADAADAAATIAGFAALAGCSRENELPAAIDRARRKAELAARVKELTGDILDQADGLRLEEAAAEAEGVNPDQCQRELAELEPAINELMSETETLSARRQVLQQRGADMATAHGAAEAEQARRNALADLEDVSERWLVLKTAAFLLRRGVEQFRREQQGPLLAHAEALFATLTLGSFTRFKIDYDETDRPCLLGVRSDGSTCPTSGMSDGTRDQLFLALRLAAIERYLAGAEALPFIADDLFVHFDDARASAGLESLIALGGKTQVLLFTHHRHLAELAREAGGGNRVRVQVLNAPV